MKNLKLGILACGALSIALVLVSDLRNFPLLLVAFAVPTAMGALGFLRPPLVQWQAIAAFAGFALAAVKLHLWDDLPHLRAIVIVVGLAVSLLAIASPEERR